MGTRPLVSKLPNAMFALLTPRMRLDEFGSKDVTSSAWPLRSNENSV
jgi:hypothetical protein